MRRALVLLGLAALLLALAPSASAGHTLGPVPDGEMRVRVGFVEVITYAPAPTSHVDTVWATACGATAGQPAGCTYTRRTCTPTDLPLLCQL